MTGRDHNHERGPVLEPERCLACHRPAIGWVRGQCWVPICSVCAWARSQPYQPWRRAA